MKVINNYGIEIEFEPLGKEDILTALNDYIKYLSELIHNQDYSVLDGLIDYDKSCI